MPNDFSASPEQQKRKRVKRGLIIAGAVTMGVGVISVAVTGGTYYSDVRTGIDPATWPALQAANTVGWALAGVGAGALIVGIALPKTPKKGKDERASLQIVPTTNGAMLRGSF